MRIAVVIGGLAVALSFGVFTSACATAGGADDTTGDSSTGDSTAVTPDGAGCPTGHTGPNCKNCASGFHACGSTCEQDHTNSPDAGCTEGCNNKACSSPTNGTAKCTSDGLCDFACDTSFDKSDAGCDCPSGQIVCGTVCQECCVDSDCPGHQTCTGGACAGCQTNWADCNNNASDGCEADLSKEPNCGSCGTACAAGKTCMKGTCG